MKSTSLRDEVLQNVCSAIQSECKSLCKAGPGAVSLLRKVSVSDMKAFTWQRLLLFLSKRAPVLLAIVKAAMQKSHSREFNSAAAGMAIAIMLNARNMFLCHTQAVLSVFLHHSGASKEVIYIYIYYNQYCTYRMLYIPSCSIFTLILDIQPSQQAVHLLFLQCHPELCESLPT